MAADDVAATAELKKKDCDPQLKQEDHVLKSPREHVSARNDRRDVSPHVYTDTLKGNGLSRCETSLNGSEPPWTSPCSVNDSGHVVHESTVRNFANLNSAAVSSSNGREGMNSRQGHWNNLYHRANGLRDKSTREDFVFRDKEQLKLSARVDLRRLQYETLDMKPFSSKRIERGWEMISAQLMNSEYTAPISIPFDRDTRSKVLAASGFSQFFVKKNLRGKEILCRSPEGYSGLANSLVEPTNENLARVSGVDSSALLNSNAKNQLSSPHGFNRATPQNFHAVISLREWLKPGCRNINKAESLHLFRQIVELVDVKHSKGFAFQSLQPSYFILLPDYRVKYTGSLVQIKSESVGLQKMNEKRLLEQDMIASGSMRTKQPKLSENMKFPRHQPQFESRCDFRSETVSDIKININSPPDIGSSEHKTHEDIPHKKKEIPTQQMSVQMNFQLEEKWYTSLEVLDDRCCTFSSNIYSLGVLLFELLCCFESSEVHSAVMLDLHNRILPPNFLSEYPMEAGFCLWLLHPEPSSRPSTREILQSELIYGSQEMYHGDDLSAGDDDTESELLLDFFSLLKEQKEMLASKLVEDIRYLEADIKEVERRHLQSSLLVRSWMQNDFPDAAGQRFHLETPTSSCMLSRSSSVINNMNEAKLMRNINQLENVYFSMRSQLQLTETAAVTRPDKDLLKNRESWLQQMSENVEPSMNQKPADRLGAFFGGLCKFARYSKLEECGRLRNGDLLNTTNVICSLSFSRDEDYIAAAGVSKKIEVFEFGALLNNFVDIHYPVVEMSNKSKLSCVCWNNYIRNYLASTDYDGVVQMWDVGTGKGFSQYIEHEKRAWSVDFSQVDPTKFASGSDDCSVKLWSINEKNSTCTIWNPANVCCVQFSSYSSHMLVFGSADYKIYCYDLRHTRIPWCILSGHGKAVSYVKFLDSETLVSASTDNTLKLWDLNKTSSTGLSSNACGLTFRGHTNEKNFVGLSVRDGYIACGSETNEVYTYYKSLPMPNTSYNFGPTYPTSGAEKSEDNGQFVSSVCWRGKSHMVVAANSTGNIKLLQLV